MQYLIATTSEVVHLIALQAVHYNPLQEVHLFRYWQRKECTAKAHPELTFLVAPIGCGIAGWRESEIAPLFREASKLPNVTLPEGFWKIIG